MYRVLYDLPSLHRLGPTVVWRGITSRVPDDHVKATAGPRLLWRQESRTTLLVQYPVQPHPSWLLPGARTSPTITDMTPLMRALAVGQQWDFTLMANAVRRLSASSHRRSGGRSSAYRGEARHVSGREWLTAETDSDAPGGTSRAYRSGFRVLALSESAERRGDSQQARLVRITGRLEVEDVEALRAALEEGMGRGKAQGAGMLSLSPLLRG